MGKRTKGQDRDKYYHLAKDQGFRARSAFKLIEVSVKVARHHLEYAAWKPCDRTDHESHLSLIDRAIEPKRFVAAALCMPTRVYTDCCLSRAR